MKAIALAVLTLACGVVPPPAHPVPAGVQVQEAKTLAARVEWALMELCVGRTEPIDRWRWYVVPGAHWQAPDGREVIGYTEMVWRRIYVAEAWVGDRGLVRHEILHALGVLDGSPVLAACGAHP